VAAGEAPTAEALAPLNAILRLGYQVLRPGHAPGATAHYELWERSPQAALLPVVLSALRLLTREDPARLRRCATPRCVALFYDTSKSGTRRWCGEDCMNRARSAQRSAQGKQADAAAAA
jgi:predicted RNA-binding Zn ribbon-like protein